MTVLLEIARFHAQCSNSNEVKDQRHPHFHQNRWDETNHPQLEVYGMSVAMLGIGL